MLQFGILQQIEYSLMYQKSEFWNIIIYFGTPADQQQQQQILYFYW